MKEIVLKYKYHGCIFIHLNKNGIPTTNKKEIKLNNCYLGNLSCFVVVVVVKIDFIIVLKNEKFQLYQAEYLFINKILCFPYFVQNSWFC